MSQSSMGMKPPLVVSPYSQLVSDESITVSVEIYRIEDSDDWILELVDADDNSTIWRNVFPSDKAAWDVFSVGLQKYGLQRLLKSSDDEPDTIE